MLRYDLLSKDKFVTTVYNEYNIIKYLHNPKYAIDQVDVYYEDMRLSSTLIGDSHSMLVNDFVKISSNNLLEQGVKVAMHNLEEYAREFTEYEITEMKERISSICKVYNIKDICYSNKDILKYTNGTGSLDVYLNDKGNEEVIEEELDNLFNAVSKRVEIIMFL